MAAHQAGKAAIYQRRYGYKSQGIGGGVETITALDKRYHDHCKGLYLPASDHQCQKILSERDNETQRSDRKNSGDKEGESHLP